MTINDGQLELAIVDYWTACVADVSCSSIDPGVAVVADPQLASAICDSRIKQLKTTARSWGNSISASKGESPKRNLATVGASTINFDADDDDINNTVVIDPAVPTAPHPLIDETLGDIGHPPIDESDRQVAIDHPSIDELDRQVAHFEASGIWEPLPALSSRVNASPEDGVPLIV